MAVVFPPNPNVGDTVTDPTTGAVWMWNGTAWVAQASGGGAFLPLAGGTMTGAIVLPGDGPSPLGAASVTQLSRNTGRNYLLNSGFAINQRNNTGAITSGWPADRWGTAIVTDASEFNLYPVDDAQRAVIGDESAVTSLIAGTAGNSAAAAYTAIQQRMEGVRRLSGKTVTLSFWAWANTAGLRMAASFDQNFGTGGSPSTGVLGNGQAVTLTTTPQRYSLTFAIPSTAGVTLGTDGNDWTALDLWFSSGTTNANRAGNIGVQTGSFGMWGFQLELGSVATPYEHRDPEIELAMCQRFFQTLYFLAQGYQVGGSDIFTATTVLVPLRAGPTITVFSGSGYSNASNLQLSALLNAIQGQITITATGYGYGTANLAISADL